MGSPGSGLGLRHPVSAGPALCESWGNRSQPGCASRGRGRGDRAGRSPPGALTLGCGRGPASEAPSPSPHRHGDTPSHRLPTPPGPGSLRGRPHPAHARPSLPHAPVETALPLTGGSVVRAPARAPRRRGLILRKGQGPLPASRPVQEATNQCLSFSLFPYLPSSLHSTLYKSMGKHPWMRINNKKKRWWVWTEVGVMDVERGSALCLEGRTS